MSSDQTNDKHDIGFFSAQFTCPEIETAYREHMQSRSLRLNSMGLGYTIFLYAVFSVADFMHFADPTIPLAVRAVSLCLAIPFFLCLKSERWTKYQDTIVMIVTGILVCGLVTVIWLSSLLAESYYLGLMQGAVLFGFVFRITFYRTLAVFLLTFCAFAFAVSGKADTEAALLQVMTLASIFAVCSFGAYFLEKIHRLDYVKARIIEKQNVELSKMLELVQGDNQRKLAAMNVLVHFVRTPIHQISGFTDVLMTSLKNASGSQDAEQIEFLESAQYIKNASHELTDNVTRLLEYHRLDELEGNGLVDEFRFSEELKEHLAAFEQTDDKMHIEDGLTLNTISESASVAVKVLSEQVKVHVSRGDEVTVIAEAVDGGVRTSVVDNGPAVSQEDFEYMICPITKIENYLTYGGSSIPMGLRTIARAVEICGGEVEYDVKDRNTLSLFLPDLEHTNVESKSTAAIA